MVKFETNGKNGHLFINLPTSIEEITPEFLTGITHKVKVADNYSLICICHKEKLSSFIMAGRSKKNEISTAVVPIFVKSGNTEAVFMSEFNVGDKIIISPSQMAMGYHVSIPNNPLTMGNLMKATEGDNYAHKNSLGYGKDVIFTEFKIVPNCDIIGRYDNTSSVSYNNPFEVEVIDDEDVKL